MSWQIQMSNKICPKKRSGKDRCLHPSTPDFDVCWHVSHPDADKEGGYPRCNEKDCPMKIEQTDTVNQTPERKSH